MFDWMEYNKFFMNDGVPTFLGAIVVLTVFGIVYALAIALMLGVFIAIGYSLTAIGWLGENVSGMTLIGLGVVIILVIAAVQSIYMGMKD